MVIQLHFWYEISYQEKVQKIQERLLERGVHVILSVTEKVNAKFLRQHPELSLIFDKDGLSIAADGMKMQPNWIAEIARLKRASLKSEMIARACHLAEKPIMIDATAGLGHDTLLMAKFGAHVTLVERHPILFTLLEDAYAQAQQDPFLAGIVENIVLVFADSNTYLAEQVKNNQYVDVVYLDPMFPQRDQNQQAIKKQAQVKKQMQLLHRLLPEDGEMDLGDNLLQLATQIAKRVIVKRPRHAIFLNDTSPQHQWLGDACRFDAYFQQDFEHCASKK